MHHEVSSQTYCSYTSIFINSVHFISLTYIYSRYLFIVDKQSYESYMFWDIMSCNLLKVNRHFGGTRCLHLQGWCISHARNCHEELLLDACFILASCWFLAWLTFQPWRWRPNVPPKCQLTFTWIYGFVPEDRILLNHHCKDVKSSNVKLDTAQPQNLLLIR
jgi:hypothetical protein